MVGEFVLKQWLQLDHRCLSQSILTYQNAFLDFFDFLDFLDLLDYNVLQT